MTDNESPRIAPGSRVTLHFSLSLSDGTEALSTFDEEPERVIMGDGTLRPGMELAIYGLQAGDEQTLTLSPDQAFGFHDENLVQTMALADFGTEIAPEPGQIIAFSLPNGEETAGTVMAVDGEEVTVDLNHPLAGRDVVFRVKVLEVEPPAR